MRADELRQAIEHLEAAKEILFGRKQRDDTRADDIFHNAYMHLQRSMIPSLRGELHYIEIEDLAKWKKASQATTKKGKRK